MGLLGGRPQTDAECYHIPAPSSAPGKCQAPTGDCYWYLLQPRPPYPQHTHTQINHHNLLYLILGQPRSAYGKYIFY